jgi:exonuclease VII large subunit
VCENAELRQQLKSLDQENTDLQQQLHSRNQQLRQKEEQLQSSEWEKQRVIQQLMKTEAELTRAEDTIMKEQQQLRQKVSGPGLTSATVNHPTCILVELSDSSGRLYSLPQNVTAQLKLVSEATPTSMPVATSRWPLTKKPEISEFHNASLLSAIMVSPSQYVVSYAANIRGQHKLHVEVNNRKINDSPFPVTVYPDPTQIGCPVQIMTDLTRPYCIAFNSHKEMVVSERYSHQLSIFDSTGKKIQTFGSRGDAPDQMLEPAGIVIDAADNIYVSSCHKLQKFNSSGELMKCTGQAGRKEGEFDDSINSMLKLTTEKSTTALFQSLCILTPLK